jgi:outer membrane receptor protein involved in Fe transport
VSHESAGDWQKNYATGATQGAKNISSFRATLAYHPLPRLKALLTLSGTLDRSDVQTGQLVGLSPTVAAEPALAAFPLAPVNARATAYGANFPDGGQLRKDNRELQATLRLDYELSDATTITSLTSGAWNRQNFAQSASATTLQVYALDRQGHVHSLSQELRAGGHFAQNRGNWVLGGSYEHDTTYENTTFDIRDANAGNVFDALGLPSIDKVPTILSTTYDSKGVFGNVDYALTSTISARAGVRYTYTGLDYDACSQNAGNLSYGTGIRTILNLTGSSIRPLVAGDCVNFAPLANGAYQLAHIQGQTNQGSTSWRAGLDWKPVAGTLLYTSVSRGYKAQAVSNIAAVFVTQYNPVPQEKLTAYEVGLKANILPGAHLNAAVFYYQYGDKQLQGTMIVPIFGPLATLVSVPKSHILGADFDLTTRPVRGLTLGAQGTFLQSRVDGDFTGTTQLGVSGNFKGTTFPNTPKWQVSGSGEYRWDVRSNLEAFVGGRYSWRSGTYGDFTRDNLLKIDAYGLLDGYVGVATKDHRWTAQIWGHNLTNRYYWASQNAFLESVVRYAGMPVTYGASLSFRY